MYTIVLVNVKRFRALCGFYAIENKLLLLFIIITISLLLASRTEVLEVMEPLAPKFGDTPSIPIGWNRLQSIGKFGVSAVLEGAL